MKFISALLIRAAHRSVVRPKLVVGAWVAAAVIACGLAAGLMEFRTSNLDLIDHDIPTVRRFLDFAESFGTPNVLVVVLEGKDEKALEAFADRAAAAITPLPSVRAVMERLPLDKDLLRDLEMEEYLRSRDHGMYFLFVQPSDTRSSVESLDPFVAAVRDAITAADPGKAGIHVGYTGIPQYALDDRDVIQKDTSRLTFVSFGLVFALFWTCFGRFRRPMCVMAALMLGVVATAGLVAIFPGHLTLLSASFASILFGLGVDYGIHIINRLEERMALGQEELHAIPHAVADVVQDITTGALTTAGIFASMWFCGFKGFAELGVVAALGVVMCLLAMCTALPALLHLFPGPPGEAARWIRGNRIGRALASLQKRGVVVATVVVLAVVAAGGHPGFDSDYLDLQPEHSETVRLERAMEQRSNLSTQFAVFLTPDQVSAGRLSEKLLAMPELVADVRCAADLEAAAPGENLFNQLPEAFRKSLVAEDGRNAVYAYPDGNVWDPAIQTRFVKAMQGLDPQVTGMPVLGHFLIHRSQEALWKMLVWGLPLLVLLVHLDFRHPLRTFLAVLPTLLTYPVVMGAMAWLDMPFNPLNMMAMPVILGIAVDDGVHLVHRFKSEHGDVRKVMLGAGRSVLLTSATTIAAFGALAATTHRGLASFSIVVSLGVFTAWVVSSLLLPRILAFAAGTRAGRVLV